MEEGKMLVWMLPAKKREGEDGSYSSNSTIWGKVLLPQQHKTVNHLELDVKCLP